MLPRLRPTCALAAAALVIALGAAAPAGAVVYEKGAPIELIGADCLASGQAYYTKQTATGSTTGINPKVGEIFYVGVTVNFFQNWDCAADFWASVITLPPNVIPAVGDPAQGVNARPICIRRAFQGNQAIDDPRAAGNCPTAVGSNNTSLSFNPMNRELRLGPKASAAFPDMSAASYWFIGQNAPAESLVYTAGAMLVPVRATATVNAPMTTLLCTVGTTCASGSTVNVTVDAASPPANVAVAVGGEAQTSAESARLPFSVTTNTQAYQLRVAVREGSAFACGQTNYQYLDVGDGGGTFEFAVGPEFDPNTADGVCYLRPDAAHTFEICHVTNTTTKAVAGCRSLDFRTSIVGTDFRSPQDTPADKPDSTTMVFSERRVTTSHDSGSYFLRRKPVGAPDGAYVGGGSVAVGEADAGGAIPGSFTWTGFTPWSAYDVQSCFLLGSTSMCGPATRQVAGYVTAPADATGVTHDAATVSGLPSAPWPAGTLSIRTSTSDPGDGDPREVMTEAASVAAPARAEATAGAPIAVGLTGLAPSTTYFWAACFDSPATAGIEDCSAARSFTTAAAPAAGPGPGPVTPSPTPSPTPGPGGPTGPGGDGAGDTSKPTLSLRVKGKLRRGKRVTLTAVASDPSGIAKVTIKVGKAKPVAKRSLKVRLPKRGRRLAVVVVAVDKAGNAATLRRTLKLK